MIDLNKLLVGFCWVLPYQNFQLLNFVGSWHLLSYDTGVKLIIAKMLHILMRYQIKAKNAQFLQFTTFASIKFVAFVVLLSIFLNYQSVSPKLRLVSVPDTYPFRIKIYCFSFC